MYGGPRPAAPRMTLRKLAAKYARGERISVVTAYDYPSAVHVDLAGFDVCLVGDSAAMVVHGHDTTLPITLDEMLTHCRAVARGAARPSSSATSRSAPTSGAPRTRWRPRRGF